jgi:Protein of unknown function (DUF3618)
MPADRSPDELRQELAAEREQLGIAVDELRARVDDLKRKVPIAAGALLAAVVLIKLARR